MDLFNFRSADPIYSILTHENAILHRHDIRFSKPPHSAGGTELH